MFMKTALPGVLAPNGCYAVKDLWTGLEKIAILRT